MRFAPPSPVSPVAIGSPIAFVSVAADGVPRFGVVSAGEVANTAAPVPVSSLKALANSALVIAPSELLEPMRPHRYRVVRLLEVSRLAHLPRRGARLPVQNISRL